MRQNLWEREPGIRLVIGIDFGTWGSAYAFRWRGELHKLPDRIWPHQPEAHFKNLTRLLYVPGSDVPRWGWDAERVSRRLADEDDDHNLMQYFKMALQVTRSERPLWPGYVAEMTPAGPQLRHAKSGRTFSVVTLVADYLRQMKKIAFEEIGVEELKVRKDEILFCLTVPAIWSDATKGYMDEAAIKAGLVDRGDDLRRRLRYALEPEAAALACYDTVNQIKAGDRFIVVDAGGGTVDITVYEVDADGSGLRMLNKPGGGKFGSAYVDQAFLDYLDKKFVKGFTEHLAQEHTQAFREFMDLWERQKCAFKIEDVMYNVSFGGAEPLHTREASEKRPACHHHDVKAILSKDGDVGRIKIPPEEMLAIFDSVIDKIRNAIRETLSDLPRRAGNEFPCDYLFLVGGFGQSKVLQYRLTKEFAYDPDHPHRKWVKAIKHPKDTGRAILNGAMLFAVEPWRVRSRCSLLTWGIESTGLFDERCHAGRKRVRNEYRNRDECHNLFSTLVTAGDVVDSELPRESEYDLSQPGGKGELKLKFFSTPKKTVTFTDEGGVTGVESLPVPLLRCPDDVYPSIKVCTYFGETKIRVTAQQWSPEKGPLVEVELRFPHTYHPEDTAT